MPKIFISYRRDDSRTITGRIYDRLSSEFGSNNVFRDINAIPLGSDFPSVIEHELASCDFLLAIIGSQWTSITDAQGRKRLDDPIDFVRVEVETALRLPDVTVIPVYVDGIRGLSSSDLPSTLEKLPRRNAAFVRDDPDFHGDVDKVIASIKKMAPTPEPVKVADVPKLSPTASALGGKFIIALLALIVVIAVIVTIVPVLNPKQGVVPTLSLTPQVQAVVATDISAIPPIVTDLPTLTSTASPTTQPSLTPLPPSATLAPTDAPTPIPPSPLPPVFITVPTVVLPDTTILVTAWPNAHCIFTPEDDSIPFGFDTSTGNIQYSVKHKAGTIVSIVCEDVQGRHAENQFVVSAASIPTATLTSMVTNTLLLPTPTITRVPPTATETPVPPTSTSIAKSYPCSAKVIQGGSNATLFNVRERPGTTEKVISTVRNEQIIIIRKSLNDSFGYQWYQIEDLQFHYLGWLERQYVLLSAECPK